jgi:hypothetical protein
MTYRRQNSRKSNFATEPPHQSDQHQLGEKEIRDHGQTPSYRWRNESILPGLRTVGIRRRLEVHDRLQVHDPCLLFRIDHG